jgi:hypothetical protein
VEVEAGGVLERGGCREMVIGPHPQSPLPDGGATDLDTQRRCVLHRTDRDTFRTAFSNGFFTPAAFRVRFLECRPPGANPTEAAATEDYSSHPGDLVCNRIPQPKSTIPSGLQDLAPYGTGPRTVRRLRTPHECTRARRRRYVRRQRRSARGQPARATTPGRSRAGWGIGRSPARPSTRRWRRTGSRTSGGIEHAGAERA